MEGNIIFYGKILKRVTIARQFVRTGLNARAGLSAKR